MEAMPKRKYCYYCNKVVAKYPNYKTKWGITESEIVRLHHTHDDNCSSCGKKETRYNFVKDSTGRYNALLCSDCYAIVNFLQLWLKDGGQPIEQLNMLLGQSVSLRWEEAEPHRTLYDWPLDPTPNAKNTAGLVMEEI